jgi:hypothetical protein
MNIWDNRDMSHHVQPVSLEGHLGHPPIGMSQCPNPKAGHSKGEGEAFAASRDPFRDNRDIGRDVTPCHSPLATVTNVTSPFRGCHDVTPGQQRDIQGDAPFAAMRNGGAFPRGISAAVAAADCIPAVKCRCADKRCPLAQVAF